MTNGERGRGVFTPKDREFLLDNTDSLTRQQKYRRRKNIKQRIRNSILDLSALLDGYGAELVDEALDDVNDKEIQRATAFLHGLAARGGFGDIEMTVKRRVKLTEDGEGFDIETEIETPEGL